MTNLASEPFAGIDTLHEPTPDLAALRARLDELEGSVRNDGWFSTITGMGTAQYDKTMSAQHCTEPVLEDEARDLYRGDPWAARAVEIRPREMFRPGWKVTISDAGDTKPLEKPTSRQDARRIMREARARLDAAATATKKLTERVADHAEKIGVDVEFQKALSWENAYGGSAILIGALDGATDWKTELKPDAINSPEKLAWLTTLESKFLEPVAWYNNPKAAKFGKVAVWRINPHLEGAGQGIDKAYIPQPIEVHETRLLIFEGTKVSNAQTQGTRQGFGDSIFTRLKSVLKRFGLGWNSAAIIINEFSLAVMKIKNLATMVSRDDQKKLLTRMAAVQLGRSVARVTLLDTEEDFTRETASLAGLADLLEKIMQELAGAVDVPVTVFMGMSPSGLNATGESDVRGWYDRLAGEWKHAVKPHLRRLVGLILRALNKGKEPENWNVEPNQWWQESPKERAETRFVDAQTDEKNIANSVYSSEEARASRYGGDAYGDEIVIDMSSEAEPTDAELLEATAAPGATSPVPATPVDPSAAPANSGKPGDTIPVNAPETPAANAAFTGIQITSMLEVVKSAINGEIPREAAKAILLVGFPVTDEQAERMLGPVGFEPKKEDPPPMPGGFGPKPPLPGAPAKPVPPANTPPKPPVPPTKE